MTPDNLHIFAKGLFMFTVNPAYPHPDQDPDTIPPPTLAEAIEYARKVLLDEKAEMYVRRRAAGDLIWSLECHEEQEK